MLACFAEASKTYRGLILKTATPFFSYDELASAMELGLITNTGAGKWPGYGMLVLAYVGSGANLKRRNLICYSHTLS